MSTKRKLQEDVIVAEETESASKKLKIHMREEMMCVICTEIFVKPTTLNCSHTFCDYCIVKWRKNHSRCPICRVRITSAAFTLVIDNLVKNMTENCFTTREKEHRDKLLEEREVNVKTMEIIEQQQEEQQRQQQQQQFAGFITSSGNNDSVDRNVVDEDANEEWDSDFEDALAEHSHFELADSNIEMFLVNSSDSSHFDDDEYDY